MSRLHSLEPAQFELTLQILSSVVTSEFLTLLASALFERGRGHICSPLYIFGLVWVRVPIFLEMKFRFMKFGWTEPPPPSPNDWLIFHWSERPPTQLVRLPPWYFWRTSFFRRTRWFYGVKAYCPPPGPKTLEYNWAFLVLWTSILFHLQYGNCHYESNQIRPSTNDDYWWRAMWNDVHFWKSWQIRNMCK